MTTKVIAVTDDRLQIAAIISMILLKGWTTMSFEYRASSTSLIIEVPSTPVHGDFLAEIARAVSVKFNNF